MVDTRHRVTRSIGALLVATAVAACGPGGSDATSPDSPDATTTSVAESSDDSAGTTGDDADPDPEDRAALAGAVVFSVNDKFTVFEDGPGVVILAGVVQVGVLRPGDGLEIEGGGPDTGTTIRAIRVGAPFVEVDSMSPDEFGYLVVDGTLDDFSFAEQLVRPID